MSVKVRSIGKNVEDNTIRKREKNCYWKNRGAQQELCDQLSEELGSKVKAVPVFDWLAQDNKYWTLFNGVKGLYYGKYNDGDNAKGAIENNRVHGFQSLESFKRFAEKLKADAVLAYCIFGNNSRLENAMNEAICLLNENK